MYTLSYNLYQTSLLLSIQCITNLASVLGALSRTQTTLRVSICDGIFDVLVGNLLSRRVRTKIGKACVSSLYALHFNSTCN